MCCQDFRDGRWLLQLGMQHAPHQAADEVRLSAVAVYHLFIAAVQFFAAALLLLSQDLLVLGLSPQAVAYGKSAMASARLVIMMNMTYWS